MLVRSSGAEACSCVCSDAGLVSPSSAISARRILVRRLTDNHGQQRRMRQAATTTMNIPTNRPRTVPRTMASVRPLALSSFSASHTHQQMATVSHRISSPHTSHWATHVERCIEQRNLLNPLTSTVDIRVQL